jgi:uncharacterized protein YjbI with pentapeptide repeats
MTSPSFSKLPFNIKILSLSLLYCAPIPSLAFWPFDLIREFFTDEEQEIQSINFENANLESKDQHNVNFQSVNFKNAKMFRSNFQQAKLRNSNFQNADMRETSFLNAVLPISNFHQADLTRSNFKGANLEISHMNTAKMVFVNFEEANLTHTHMDNSDMRKSDFKQAILMNTSLKSSDIYQANFEGASIIHTDFKGSAMESNSFQGTEIQGAQFQGANLRESNFRSAYIHPEKLDAPQNSYTPFGCIAGSFRAKIHYDDSNTPERKSDAKWEKLNKNISTASSAVEPEACTNFEETSFKDAILYKVNFSIPQHVNFSNLTVEQLCQARSLYQSTFPPAMMKTMKKNKACYKKITDKALFEQAQNDFFKSKKSKSYRNRF